MTTPKNPSSDSGKQLDLIDQIELLVENELSAAERSLLLLRLDTQPEQWRNLALAFVEHQVLRTSIQEVCCSSDPTEPAANSSAELPSRPQTSSSKINWLAIAASFLLVFAAGMGVGNWDRVPAIALQQVDPAQSDSTEPSSGSLAEDRPAPAAGQNVSASVVGYVEWNGSFGKQLSPVFSGTEIDKEWLERNPPQVNEKLERSFARAGWRISPERRFVSLKLAEGKQFMIPMDDVSYRYVGRELL